MELSREATPSKKISTRNLIMFPLGTFGRDFVYGLFTAQLLNYILFTKEISEGQFATITLIIVAARLFDAFNDPIMGGIVENTRSKWGKFKPWQLSGAILTALVIIGTFTNTLQGNDFVILLGVLYFMFSITFTMNDISYWGMMPSLTSNEHDRSKLMSFAQLVASAGGGLVGILVPAFTVGGLAIGGSAVIGYRVIAIIAAVLMVSFQLFTILGVQEEKISNQVVRGERITLKEMFKKIFNNDQLMWAALILLIFCTGTGIVGAGLSTAYIYFEFGYVGLLLTLFFVLFGIANTIFTVTYPMLEKKFTRTRIFYSTGIALIVGYLMMLVFGLVLPSGAYGSGLWYAKFGLMALANGFIGYGHGFYMIMVICIANTVEYNEYKTGRREEGLIFSLRPFTAKLSSALSQGMVTAVYLIAGVLTYTNQIAALENKAATQEITSEFKLEQIEGILSSVAKSSKTILLICMCVIPAIFIVAAMAIYRKKYILDEKTFAKILQEIDSRKSQEETID